MWTASVILAKAAIMDGKYAQSFPEFGPERMGAPVRAFTRIDERPISLHCNIYSPDVIVVLDPTLLGVVDVREGLRRGGIALFNTRKSPGDLSKALRLEDFTVLTVPATDIAMKVMGRPIANTAMLGALIKATGAVALGSVIKATRERFPGRVGELNSEVIERSYREVVR